MSIGQKVLEMVEKAKTGEQEQLERASAYIAAIGDEAIISLAHAPVDEELVIAVLVAMYEEDALNAFNLIIGMDDVSDSLRQLAQKQIAITKDMQIAKQRAASPCTYFEFDLDPA